MKQTRFNQLYNAAIDALLSGGAFTQHHERLKRFTDEKLAEGHPSEGAPQEHECYQAAAYIGEFLTDAGLSNIASVHVRPRNEKFLSITVERIVNGRRKRQTRDYLYKRRRLELVHSKPVTASNFNDYDLVNPHVA